MSGRPVDHTWLDRWYRHYRRSEIDDNPIAGGITASVYGTEITVT